MKAQGGEARVTLVVIARQGDVEQVIHSPWRAYPLRSTQVVAVARDGRQPHPLSQQRYPTQPAVRSFRDQLQTLNQTADLARQQ